MSEAIVLPDSRLKSVLTPRNAVNRGGVFWVPIFCLSCAVPGGLVPEENMTGVSYFCDACADKYGNLDGLMIPDRVFFALVQQEQIEKYGRILTADETVAALADPASLESRLARDRANLTPKPPT